MEENQVLAQKQLTLFYKKDIVYLNSISYL